KICQWIENDIVLRHGHARCLTRLNDGKTYSEKPPAGQSEKPIQDQEDWGQSIMREPKHERKSCGLQQESNQSLPLSRLRSMEARESAQSGLSVIHGIFQLVPQYASYARRKRP